jgi:hypothetical protein
MSKTWVNSGKEWVKFRHPFSREPSTSPAISGPFNEILIKKASGTRERKEEEAISPLLPSQ